jgi:hypothetical protein
MPRTSDRYAMLCGALVMCDSYAAEADADDGESDVELNSDPDLKKAIDRSLQDSRPSASQSLPAPATASASSLPKRTRRAPNRPFFVCT